MKVNKKIKIKIILSILLFFSICLFNSILNLKLNSIENPKYEIDNVNIKTQGFWDLTGTTIFIDDNNPSIDWAYHASQYDWCSGSGTFNNPYIIENVSIDGLASQSCICIRNSKTPYFVIRNCSLLYAPTNHGAMEILNSSNGLIINNTCTNSYWGIEVGYNSENNTILNNLLYNNEVGILVSDCNENTMIYNTITQNSHIGMRICDGSRDNNITSNQIINNGDDWAYRYCGLLIENCLYNNILNNTITYNAQNGIVLDDASQYNLVSGNNISENTRNGIYLIWSAIGNEISDNLIMKNGIRGIYIADTYPFDNKFFLNKFIKNGVNARDDDNNIGNFWDNGTIGNSWDDYIGVDADDDGIGDTPYTIDGNSGGNMDFFPIWYSPPNITINSPNTFDIFGVAAPSYDVYISDPNLNTTWYTINNEIQKFNFTVNGTIYQDLWDTTPEGQVVITFYANDTRPNLSFKSVIIIKDVGDPPSISINSPLLDTLYGDTSPTFNVEITDPNLNTTWYSLDGGITRTIFSSNESIDQSIWEITPDGPVVITFYANDTAGNQNSNFVLIQKDTAAPIIQINLPATYVVYGASSISFNVEIFDLNLEIMWYTIEGSLTNIIFTANGTIDNALWNSYTSGHISIVFYANDTLGRLSYKSVTITKDIDAPIINIISPSMGDVFYNISPTYEISVIDPHLDSMWYSIDEGSTVLMISEISGSISQILWDGAPLGTITLTIYANDTVGNIAYKEVIISKESISPPTPNNTVRGYEIFIFTGTLIIISIIFGKNKFIKKKR